tara:strand:+ start:448152 stop:449990 length:1839 start_codon:yes stop_codon:yes gene_type:complete
MGAGFDERKWWHTVLKVGSVEFGTRSGAANENPNDRITARVQDTCDLTDIPVPAWDGLESPGFFIYRPAFSDVSGAAKSIDSYEAALDLANREPFTYELYVAYDSSDAACTSVGPPDTHDPDVFASLVDDSGFVFTHPNIASIDSIGCCEIDLDNPGDPIDPGDLQECSRIWYLNIESSPQLYSYDFDRDPGQEIQDRGTMASQLGGGTNFHDIAWDDDDRLWALESNGIRQVIPGSSSVIANVLDYVTINGDTSNLFPISVSSTGSPGMTYNQHSQRMYITANGRLFELEKSGTGQPPTQWTVVREAEVGSDLRDLAADPFNVMYCIYNDSLATVDIADAFGTVQYVNGETGDFANFNGLDFILTLGGGSLATLYGLDVNGDLVEIDFTDGSKTIISDITSNPGSVVGASSCQAGEDNSLPVFPFYPGESPWIFMLDGSTSMNGIPTGRTDSRWEILINGMVAFIENNVRLGERLFMVIFGPENNPRLSPEFTFNTTGDIQAAADWIANLSGFPNNSTNFCEDGPFNTSWLDRPEFNGINSIVVVGDGGFSAPCPDGSALFDYCLNVITFFRGNGNPNAIVRAVGIYPSSDGRADLMQLGAAGDGGYTEWI